MSCDTKEKLALQQKVDSLNVQLETAQQVEQSMNEVGMLIDSIDANRKSLELNMVEGRSHTDQVARLREINNYVKRTETKIAELEQKVNSSNSKSSASYASIKRLKADLEKQSLEIVSLQEQLATAQNENVALSSTITQKDSVISVKEQMIATNETDIASLEKVMEDTKLENKLTVANLYYEQAEALEMAANRTQFAPRKKRETKQEALELYKLSLSLGKTEAESKINELEL